MTNPQENIRKKYEGAKLGITDVEAGKYFYTYNFENPEELLKFIDRTAEYETTFTKKGIEFIEEYYGGLDKVAKMVTEKFPEFPYDKAYTAKQWLLVKKEHAIDPL